MAIPRVLLVDSQVLDFLQYRIVLARTLQELGCDVHVALPQEAGLEAISRQGIPTHVIHLCRMSVRLLDEQRCLATLIRLFRRLRPSLVHNITLKPSLYGGIAARITGVPSMVSTVTGFGQFFRTSNLKRRILWWTVSRGLQFGFRHPNHRVIIQNPDDRDRLIASAIVPRDCAVLIKGSGVDLTLFTPKPEPEGPPVILMACRMLWEKGVGEFVATARALRACGIGARFLLAGEPDPGHPSAVPLSMLRHWHDSGDVEWLGWRHDMAALIEQSHIVCLPSYYGEGVPRILIEAAASGRPIVTTDSPGCREIVRHGHNGLLVPVREVEALVGAIVRLIEDVPLRAAMAARAREMAANEFSLGQVINANLAVYRSLLGGILAPSLNTSGTGQLPL
jgi:glycosyltransferase involved in cell wall biosynthesis